MWVRGHLNIKRRVIWTSNNDIWYLPVEYRGKVELSRSSDSQIGESSFISFSLSVWICTCIIYQCHNTNKKISAPVDETVILRNVIIGTFMDRSRVVKIHLRPDEEPIVQNIECLLDPMAIILWLCAIYIVNHATHRRTNWLCKINKKKV